MKVAVPAELDPSESRVAATPETVRKIRGLGAEVAVEHSARRQLPLTAGPLVRTGLRRYGESALAFYRAEE